MKWGNKDTKEMDNNHLKNTINWIKRQLLLIPADLKYFIYKEIVISFRYSQIACIEAELLFRTNNIDNRNTVETIHTNISKIFDFYQKNEKMFRIGKWQTMEEISLEMRIRSDEKFEDNFGHSPYDYEEYDPEENCYFDDNL
jgi:hypothetical protein